MDIVHVEFSIPREHLIDLETLLLVLKMTQHLAPRQVEAIDTLTTAIDAVAGDENPCNWVGVSPS